MYIESPDWIKSKKATINLINKKDNKCFQCTTTITLNLKEYQRISKIDPSIDKSNLEGINYPSGNNGWKKLKKIS